MLPAVMRQAPNTVFRFTGSFKKMKARSMGVSMVMTNTEKGKAMFDKIKNQLYFEEKTYEDAIIDNHNLIHPDIRPKERDFVYNELNALSPKEFMEKFNCKLFVPTPLWKRVIKRLRRLFIK